MIKDYSFLNYMLDDNRQMPEEIIHGLLGEWLTNGKLYHTVDDKQYYIYRFENTNAGILLKTRKAGENKGQFEDFQPIVFGNESIKCKISSINKEKEQCVLLYDDKCLIICAMDPMGFKEDDEIYVNFNFFAHQIELRKNEDDYYNHLHKTNDGEFNIFNIGLEELVPPIALIKGDRDKYPLIKDESLEFFDDSFMMGSGKIINSYMIEPKIKVDGETDLPNNELPLGKCDCYEFKSKIGLIPAIVEEEILGQFMQKEKIEKFKLDKESIIKVYGYIGALIDIEKTLKQK